MFSYPNIIYVNIKLSTFLYLFDVCPQNICLKEENFLQIIPQYTQKYKEFERNDLVFDGESLFSIHSYPAPSSLARQGLPSPASAAAVSHVKPS